MNQEQMIEKFFPVIEKHGKIYSKSAIVSARPAIAGEVIVTNTSDGKETQNTATKDSFVVKNPTGEEYILPKDMFLSRYEHISGSNYKALGKYKAIVWHGDEFKFIASWGEEMVVKNGDMLACPIPCHKKEIYRIASHEFGKTYSE